MAWQPILYLILTQNPRLNSRRARLRLVHN